MNLKDIAQIAVDEAMGGTDAEQLPDGVEMTDNGDGTVTYSMAFSLDPKVQAEMSKAMPKGEKREDQVDKVGEAEAQDEAPKGVFAMALDEAIGSVPSQTCDGIALDASPTSRHANTPLENCRAKDPMFCPYHGQVAIQKWIENEIQNVFKSLPNPNGSTIGMMPKVVVKDDGTNKSRFEVTITASKSNMLARAAVGGAITNLFNKNGIQRIGISKSTPSGAYDVPASSDYRAELMSKPDYDKADMLKEWSDDLMIDVANDPQLQQEIDPKEFADFLGKLDAVGQAQAGTPAYDTALADAEKAYHMLRGQVEYKGVNSEAPLMQEAGSAEYHFNVANQAYHHSKSEVDAVKKIIFKNGKFPNGFAKANPFAANYNAASQAVGYFADKAFHDADDEYVPLMKALQNRKATPAELQRLKGLVSAVKFGEKNYVNAADKYFKAKKEFMQELYDWANSQNPKNGAIHVHPNLVQRAFPNGRPQ